MPLMPEQPKPQKKANRWINEVLYGIINAIVGAPTMISFAAIVYQVHPPHAVPCDAAGVKTQHSSLCRHLAAKIMAHITHTSRGRRSSRPSIDSPAVQYLRLLGRPQECRIAEMGRDDMHLSSLRMLCTAG